jgi:hypothetical protein
MLNRTIVETPGGASQLVSVKATGPVGSVLFEFRKLRRPTGPSLQFTSQHCLDREFKFGVEPLGCRMRGLQT